MLSNKRFHHGVPCLFKILLFPLGGETRSRRQKSCPPLVAVSPQAGGRLSAFSLVELLVVMAIIGIMSGLSIVALQGMRAPAVQHAAEQVMSGLSLARQLAITKNTQAAFLIADQAGAGFPDEPFRYWSVVYSNRGSNTWTRAKNWEKLPDGAFILETRGQSGAAYSSISGVPLSTDYDLGAVTPDKFDLETFTIDGTPISNTDIACIQFSSDGSASGSAIAIRIAQGSVLNGAATLASTNQYYFVETDSSIGRIRMRGPESYRNP